MKTPKDIAAVILNLMPSEQALMAYEVDNPGFLYLANRPAPSGVTASEKTWRIRCIKKSLEALINEDSSWFNYRHCIENTWEFFKSSRTEDLIDEALDFSLKEKHGYWMSDLIWQKLFEGTPLEFKRDLRIEGITPSASTQKQRVWYGDKTLFYITEGEFKKWALWGDHTWDIEVLPIMGECLRQLPTTREDKKIEITGFNAFVQLKKLMRYKTEGLKKSLNSPLLNEL